MAKFVFVFIFNLLNIFNAFGLEIIGSPNDKISKLGMEYSCEECHRTVKKEGKKQTIGEHQDIVVKHDNKKCLDCHAGLYLDRLRLKSGEFVRLSQTTRFCLDCHEELKTDWKLGIHGKNISGWKAKNRVSYSCVKCHDSHQPKFRKRVPIKPPLRYRNEKR